MGNATTYEESNEESNEETGLEVLQCYQYLITMGFDDTVSLEASNKFKGDRNKSIEYIISQQNDNELHKNDDHKKAGDSKMDSDHTEKKELLTENSNVDEKINDKNQQNNTMMIFHNIANEIRCDSINQCLSIERMKLLLEICNTNKNNASVMNMIHEELSPEYKITHILNDYIHIINNHSNNDDFENVYNTLNIKCKLDKCDVMRRNYRDRTKTHPQNMNNIKMNENTKDRVITDIIDQIHSYLLHTFDIGYRLTAEEKQMIGDSNKHYSFTKMRNLLSSKRKVFSNITRSDSRMNHSKFITYTNDDINNENKEDEDKKSDDIPFNGKDTSVYSFSHRFDYWEDATSNLCIEAKYKDLKDEILNNIICKLQAEEFIAAENKAQRFLMCDHAKNMKCNGKWGYDTSYSTESSNVRAGSLLGLLHFRTKYFTPGSYSDEAPLWVHNLIVLILYCDYDVVSYKFSSTFRAANKNQSFKELKNIHSNYYWFARYLRETVEGYGKELDGKVKECVYHGVSANMTFTSTIAKFHHPTSTTKLITVAQIFATNNGMILTLSRQLAYCAPRFQCQWISAFANEEESLFIGGVFPLRITNILDCSTGEEYKKYLKATSIFNEATTSGWIGDMDNECENLIRFMVNKDQQVPSYVLHLFSSYCQHAHNISIDFADQKRYSKYLLSLFFVNKTPCVNLQSIASLFPNCVTIRIKSTKIELSEAIVTIIAKQLIHWQWEHLQIIELADWRAGIKGSFLEQFELGLARENLKATKFNIRERNETSDIIIKRGKNGGYGQSLQKLANCLYPGQTLGIHARYERLIRIFLNKNNSNIFKYITDCFEIYRTKINKLYLQKEIQYSSYLSSLFLTNAANLNESFVNVKNIIGLFPKCEDMTITFDISISKQYVESIISALSQCDCNCLKNITIKKAMMETNGNLESIIESLQIKFQKMTGFTISMEKIRYTKRYDVIISKR